MTPVLGMTEDLRTLYPRMIAGDAGVVGAFADRATVDSPMGGKQQPAEFAAEARAWLARHSARAVDIHTVITARRVIHELNLFLTLDGALCELPVMLIADAEKDRIRDLRVYHSTWPLNGKHAVRPPMMEYSLTERPPEPVGSYHDALMKGDAAMADSQFEPNGCVREPAGGPWEYCGLRRTKWYRDVLSIGPIVLHLGTISDDGETVVYEYMADRWGADPMPPQAGAAAYQRGHSGLLCAARIYDDVQPPSALGDI